MPKFSNIKGKEFIKYLIKYGCVEDRCKASHHFIKYPLKNTNTTVAYHGSKDMSSDMIKVSLKDLQIDVDEFFNFINEL